MKPEVALYVGGMGHRDKSFDKDMMMRRGYREAAERIQELYLAGHEDEAAAAVPDDGSTGTRSSARRRGSKSAIAPERIAA